LIQFECIQIKLSFGVGGFSTYEDQCKGGLME